MGVPKFFRYISERYPALSELIYENEIPEFDNLYLDMNGIVHNCSHPNDFDPLFRITEEKIFKDIFIYIEHLFRKIKPKKLFFMAIDGVAPRAKMNQQRGRRFRSAREAFDLEEAARKRGESIPDEEKFDSNCITPGTPFMVKLHEQLKYFVTLKISTDKLWENVTVILSGHETPGEGEHKIMDYIRFLKSKEDYNPNTRHCLYGLDADLIMLGLCTHEPHFSLLREEVKFGRQPKKVIKATTTNFFLLHLKLMREYLEMEFEDLKKTLPFSFNLECVIDDWILMGFLVGNDFLPNLPGLHINEGAFPAIFDVYKKVLPTLDGYLNEGGNLNLARFEIFMKKLATFDIQNFRDNYLSSKFFGAKSGDAPVKAFNPDDFVPWKEDEDESDVPFFMDETEKDSDDSGERVAEAVLDLMAIDEYECKEDEKEDRLQFYSEFKMMKDDYYRNKVDCSEDSVVSKRVLKKQAECYVQAIQWNLSYYYHGIQSWSWFYPYHYAPYITDIQNFKDMCITYEMGKPFLPFEQLLAVLPSLSKKLLPKPFQDLMTNEDSSIINYYPSEFETDLNGKKNDWEAVVLIPFIDEEVLLKAMQACYDLLTPEELERNKHGPALVYRYTPRPLEKYTSPVPYFADVLKNHAAVAELTREALTVPTNRLRIGLCPGVDLSLYLPGFPTFQHLQFTSQLRKERVKVFQHSSMGDNMIVTIITKQGDEEEKEEDELSSLSPLLGQTMYAYWPYLKEARIVGFSDENSSLSWDPITGVKMKKHLEADIVEFNMNLKRVTQTCLKTRGIDLGNTRIMAQVNLFDGENLIFTAKGDVKMEKTWKKEVEHVPFQTLVKEVKVLKEQEDFKMLEDLFPVGFNVVMSQNAFYGKMGTVVESSVDGRLKITVVNDPEPDLKQLGIIDKSNIRYYPSHALEQEFGISSYMVSRITGTLFVLDADNPEKVQNCSKVNIGLDLKFTSRNLRVLGMTKKINGGPWLYSEKAVNLVKEYLEEFPEIYCALENNTSSLLLRSDMKLNPEVTDKWFKDVDAWLKKKMRGIKYVNNSGEFLEPDVLENMKKRLESFKKENRQYRKVTVSVKPMSLIRPMSNIAAPVDPFLKSKYRLLDRVVHIKDQDVIAFGKRGTVIGIESSEDDQSVHCFVYYDKGSEVLGQLHEREFKVASHNLLNVTQHQREQQTNVCDRGGKAYAAPNKITCAGKIPNLMDVDPRGRGREPRIDVFEGFTRLTPSSMEFVMKRGDERRNEADTVAKNISIMEERTSFSDANSHSNVGVKGEKPTDLTHTEDLSNALKKALNIKKIKEGGEVAPPCSSQPLPTRLHDNNNKNDNKFRTMIFERSHPAIGDYPCEVDSKGFPRLKRYFEKLNAGVPTKIGIIENGGYKVEIHIPKVQRAFVGKIAPTLEEAEENTCKYVMDLLEKVPANCDYSFYMMILADRQPEGKDKAAYDAQRLTNGRDSYQPSPQQQLRYQLQQQPQYQPQMRQMHQRHHPQVQLSQTLQQLYPGNGVTIYPNAHGSYGPPSTNHPLNRLYCAPPNAWSHHGQYPPPQTTYNNYNLMMRATYNPAPLVPPLQPYMTPYPPPGNFPSPNMQHMAQPQPNAFLPAACFNNQILQRPYGIRFHPPIVVPSAPPMAGNAYQITNSNAGATGLNSGGGGGGAGNRMDQSGVVRKEGPKKISSRNILAQALLSK